MSAAFLTRSSISLDHFVSLFALTALIQALHMVEHVAQVIQKFVLHIAPAHILLAQAPQQHSLGLFTLQDVHRATALKVSQ